MSQHTDNMHWLAEGDPLKIKAFERMGCLEYFVLLDAKMGEQIKKVQQNLQEQARGSRPKHKR